MELTIHQQVLASAVVIGLVIGGVSSKTNFCTLGAVSDWVNMGDTARMRAWLLAIAVAILGVTLLDATGLAVIGVNTFPPYQTPNFAWLRYEGGGDSGDVEPVHGRWHRRTRGLSGIWVCLGTWADAR